MRWTEMAALMFPLSLLMPVASQASDVTHLDVSALQVLAEKADHAALRDQCFLYAELVRGSTELANSELASGDREAAGRSLQLVETYTASLDKALAMDAKKLKDAEILLRESAFKLHAAMLAASIDDRPAMASALTRIDAVETRVMSAVFAH